MRLASYLIPLSIAFVATSAHADAPSRASRDAESAVHFADVAGRRLLGLLGDARTGRNPQQVACVDEKLTQVNSFARILQERRQRLLSAEARGDAAAARYESMVIRNLHTQLRQLEREGRACLFPGAEAADGVTIVEVIVDRDVPNLDLSLDSAEERRRRW